MSELEKQRIRFFKCSRDDRIVLCGCRLGRSSLECVGADGLVCRVETDFDHLVERALSPLAVLSRSVEALECLCRLLAQLLVQTCSPYM